MHKLLIILAFAMSGLFSATAQDSDAQPIFKARASQTEVLLGNYIEVSFVLENARGGRFQAPDWAAAGFAVRSGPNQSSQFSMVNGVTKSSITYSYYVQPRDTGLLRIPEVSVRNGEEELKTEPLEIRVLPNPDGIIEMPEAQETYDIWGRPTPAPQPEPAVPPKKKRKTTRI